MSEPLEPSGRSRPWRWIVLFLVVGMALFAWVRRSAGPGKGGVEFVDAVIEKGNITATVSATGGLESITTVTVGSQVSGPVRSVDVDFNAPVRKGQVLAVLDPAEFEARLNEAEAGLEVSRAGLETANAKIANSRAAISQSQTQVEGARAAYQQVLSQIEGARADFEVSQAAVQRSKAEMDNALLEYKRYETLFSTQLVAASERDQRSMQYRVSSSAYESALASARSSQARLRQMQAQLSQARNSVDAALARIRADQATLTGSQAEVGSALARVRQSEAVVQKARVDLGRTVIRSPVDGTVIDRKIEPGQTVAASFTAPELFKIAKDLRQMQVRADVSEADIGRVTLGQKVTFTVDAYPESKFAGKVTQVRSAPVSSANSTNNVVVYGVLISAPNPKLLLKPGMTATIEIAAEELKDIVLIPEEALRFLPPHPPDPEEQKASQEKKAAGARPKPKSDIKRNSSSYARPGVVWVPGPGGPLRREVQTGISDGKNAELIEGELAPGDKVYVKVVDEEKSKRKRFRISF